MLGAMAYDEVGAGLLGLAAGVGDANLDNMVVGGVLLEAGGVAHLDGKGEAALCIGGGSAGGLVEVGIGQGIAAEDVHVGHEKFVLHLGMGHRKVGVGGGATL